jgi:hypothetical protein
MKKTGYATERSVDINEVDFEEDPGQSDPRSVEAITPDAR